MTNTKALQAKMLELDFTVAKLALAVNLSTTGLFNKIHNKREFRKAKKKGGFSGD